MDYLEIMISFALSFLISFSATPIAKKLAFKLGAIDVPKDDRRMHKKPIARLGGLAIVVGFMFGLLFNLVSSTDELHDLLPQGKQLIGLCIGMAIIIAVGITDDIKPVKAKIKFIFQILAAVIVVATDIRIQCITNPFAPEGYTELHPVLSYILTVLWIVGITNAINLIDGLDGLAAGVSSISSLSLFFISVISKEHGLALMTVILAGSTLGFLPYNFNPAKIFMGDTGSTFLGFSLAVISVQGTLKSYAAIAIAIPVLVLGLPLFDTTFAILRRIIEGKPIMQPDRGHLHHRLVDMGLSQRQSVVVMYIASAVLGLCAIVLVDKGPMSALILVVAVSIFVVGGARYMSELNDDGEDSDNNTPLKEDKDMSNEEKDYEVNNEVNDDKNGESDIIPQHEMKKSGGNVV